MEEKEKYKKIVSNYNIILYLYSWDDSRVNEAVDDGVGLLVNHDVVLLCVAPPPLGCSHCVSHVLVSLHLCPE